MKTDLIGRTFNRWTVMSFVKQRGKHAMWRCICECGTEATIAATNLTRNLSKSCGCYRRDYVAKRNYEIAKHHGCGTPEYEVWTQIIKRCINNNHRDFHNYGGRGITICDEWRHDFAAFRDYIGTRPSADHSIDRIDNNRGYEPGNCRWATRIEQGRNRRTSHTITHNGQTLTVTEWAKWLNLNRATLFSRLRKGWPISRALTP